MKHQYFIGKTALIIPGIILGIAALPAQALPISLQNATANFSQTGFEVDQAIDGVIPAENNAGANPGEADFNGWAIHPNPIARTAVFETTTDFSVSGVGGELSVTMTQFFGNSHNIGKFDLSVTNDDRDTFADGLANGGAVIANWVLLSPSSATSTNGETLNINSTDSSIKVDFNPPNPFSDVYTINAFTTLGDITGIRLRVFEDADLPSNGPGTQANGNFVLTEFEVDWLDANQARVPEPGTLALFGIGLVGLGALARRRRRTA